MDAEDLERLVDRELKGLPRPHAPRTLLPRVMVAIAAPRVQPWYSRPWLAWPLALRALSVVLVVAVGAGAWSLWREAPAILGQVNQAAAVARALWNVLLGPIAWFVLGLTVIVALACAAAWTAVSRVTFGGASSQ